MLRSIKFFLKDTAPKQGTETKSIDFIDPNTAELANYKAAFKAMSKALPLLSEGKLETRITDWDEYGELSPTLAQFNRFADLLDAYIREVGGALEAAVAKKFYRKFLTRGMPDHFGSGIKPIDYTAQAMQRESIISEARSKLAETYSLEVLNLVNNITDSLKISENIASSLKQDSQETKNLSDQTASVAKVSANNVQTVAAAVEELNMSINKIAEQIESSSEQATNSAILVKESASAINLLKEDSEKIRRVVNLINDIANQTNLFALNATIEAARAGVRQTEDLPLWHPKSKP